MHDVLRVFSRSSLKAIKGHKRRAIEQTRTPKEQTKMSSVLVIGHLSDPPFSPLSALFQPFFLTLSDFFLGTIPALPPFGLYLIPDTGLFLCHHFFSQRHLLI